MDILPRLLLLLCALPFWYACSSAPPVTGESGPAHHAREDSLRAALVTAGIDSQQTYELTHYLRPLLFSSLADRDLENWYVNKTTWTDKFGDARNVLFVAELICEDYLRRGEISEASWVKNAIGRLYAHDGDYPSALDVTKEAYELARRAGDSTSIGWNLNLLSYYFLARGDLPTAHRWGQRSLKYGREIRNPAIEALSLIILGGVQAYRQEYDSSLVLTEHAVAIAKANDLHEIARRGMLNISYNYNHLGRFDESIAYLKKNIDFNNLAPSIHNIFLCFNLQGGYLGKKEFARATFYLDKGCAMADELGFVYAQLHCEKYRTALFREQGDYEGAFAASLRTQEIQERIASVEQTREVQSLKTRLRLLEKDLEIEKMDQASKDRELTYQQRLRRFIVVTVILATLLLGVYFVMRNRHRIKSAEQSKQLAETKLQVLQSQMHPHFVFNALGGVQNYVLKEDKIAAYKYLGKFATLLRMVTRSSTQVHIELDQEIEFIRSYLDMEKLRFRDDFDYTLSVDPALEQTDIVIPGMVIQPIVENALIHGLTGLERKGKLTVNLEPCPEKGGICCIVSDNGRGRAAAKQLAAKQGERGHLSIATVNIDKRLDFLRRLGYRKVAIEMEDLYDAGGAGRNPGGPFPSLSGRSRNDLRLSGKSYRGNTSFDHWANKVVGSSAVISI